VCLRNCARANRLGEDSSEEMRAESLMRIGQWVMRTKRTTRDYSALVKSGEVAGFLAVGLHYRASAAVACAAHCDCSSTGAYDEP
jgi:hypothetical protein